MKITSGVSGKKSIFPVQQKVSFLPTVFELSDLTGQYLLAYIMAGLALISFVHFANAQGAPVPNAAIVRQSGNLLVETVKDSGPGVAMMISRGNTVLLRSAKGRANIELNVPLSTDQVFRIASITKIFTAALILKLAEDGNLSIDDKLSRFLPDLSGAETITIRQLLNHTAGVSDQVPPNARQPGFSRRDVDTATHIIEIAKRSPDFTPGSRQSYSNAGYILLGAVIEKITGKPWYTALEEKFLKPLGLKNTTYGLAGRILPGRVSGYTTATPDHVAANASFISLSIPAAAGGLVSTLDDLRLWMRHLVDGRVINKADFQQMITPAALPRANYGFGMYIWSVRGETMIGHTGQIDGFASILAYLPSKDITIIAIGNDDNFDAQNFGRRLAAITLGKPYAIVKNSVAIPASDLAAIPGQYADGNDVRTIIAKDGKLYSQRPGRDPYPLQMTANGELHFMPDELSYFVPIKDASGKVIRLDYYNRGDGPPKQMLRVDSQTK